MVAGTETVVEMAGSVVSVQEEASNQAVVNSSNSSNKDPNLLKIGGVKLIIYSFFPIHWLVSIPFPLFHFP